MNAIRVGYGYDAHRLQKNRKLILGGIEIPHNLGLAGHSDADVLLHAISDALLGALALGDIGKHFPDTDQSYKNADSRELLRKCYRMITDKGYRLVNLDTTVIAEKPKINPHIQNIRTSISEILDCEMEQISIKASTSEKMGFVGREEGIAAHANVLIAK